MAIVAKLVIDLLDTGETEVTGPIENPFLCKALLAEAGYLVDEARRKMPEETKPKRSKIIVPPIGGLPRGPGSSN